jgi:hypothetical protein
MFKLSTCALALAITIGAPQVFAADMPAGQMAADKDFGKLSIDGSTAIRDVRLARIAIFNGQPDKAKSFISEAQTSIGKAKSDDTVFMKAESDLKAPQGSPQSGSTTASTTPVKWIPVDGSMTLGEDYIATPEKTAGVAKANEQLKKGQSKEAVETLKLANIDVSYMLEVAPLDKTTNGIAQAEQMIVAGKYYEANQALKGVEDSLRIDIRDYDGTPKKATGTGTSVPNAQSPATNK